MTAGQRWSRDRPTAPGWYWFRFTPETVPDMFKDEIDAFEPCISYVEQEAIDDPDPERLSNGEWCGPLEPPHDQEAG